MDESKEVERSEPRSVTEIFEDLRILAQSDGALHEISSLIYRDHFVAVDPREGHVIDEPESRWSTLKLNKNEVLLLLGLMVQSQTERTYAVQSAREGFAARADVLLREFHDRVLADFTSTVDRSTGHSSSQRIRLASTGGKPSITDLRASTFTNSSTSAVSAMATMRIGSCVTSVYR